MTDEQRIEEALLLRRAKFDRNDNPKVFSAWSWRDGVAWRDANPKPLAESDEKLRDKLAKCAFPKPTPYWNNHGPLFSPNAVCKAVRAGFKTGWNAARANDPRVTKIGENVTTENVSNENVSNESDEKLRDEAAEMDVRSRHGQFSTKADWEAADFFKRGWNAARANPDPRVRELVEAIQKALDHLEMFNFANDNIRVAYADTELRDALRKFEGRGT